MYETFYYFFIKEYFKKNLDKKIKNLQITNLNELFSFFNTDKANNYIKNSEVKNGHYFAPFYEKHFINLKNNEMNILELGVLNGSSTASFFYFFTKSKFYCIDLDKKQFLYKSKRINFFEISLRDKEKIRIFTNLYKNYFDIIIDDASHYKSCIIENFNNFFSTLSINGTYIIEDYKFPEIYKSKNDLKNELHISEILSKLKHKKLFESKIISKKKIKIMNNKINNIYQYKGRRLDSHIAFLKLK